LSKSEAFKQGVKEKVSDLGLWGSAGEGFNLAPALCFHPLHDFGMATLAYIFWLLTSPPFGIIWAKASYEMQGLKDMIEKTKK